MELACKLDFVELDQESVTIDGVKITTKAMNHPIRVLAFRLEKEGKSIVYTGDNEPYYDVMYDPARPDTMVEARAQFVLQCRQEVIDFLKGANLLIADAQYTDEEYRQKRGWGHCSVTHAVDFAVQAGVESMALFHHEPIHSDEQLDGMLDEARRMVRNAGRDVKVMMAREGITVQV
jgi:ribonuclease BN (tRNA processing enzyme)